MASAWFQEPGCIASTIVAIGTLAISIVEYTRNNKDTIAVSPSSGLSLSACPSLSSPSPSSPTPHLPLSSPPYPPPPSAATYSMNARFQNAGLVVSTLLAIASLVLAIAEFAKNGEDTVSVSPSSPYGSTPSPSFRSPFPSTSYPSTHPPSFPSPFPSTRYPSTTPISFPSPFHSPAPTSSTPAPGLQNDPAACTPGPTLAPGSSLGPSSTLAPGSTFAPGSTLAPGATLAPGSTHGPGTTPAPGVTLAPTMLLSEVPTASPTPASRSLSSLAPSSSPSSLSSSTVYPSYEAAVHAPNNYVPSNIRRDWLALVLLLASIFFLVLSGCILRSKTLSSHGEEQQHSGYNEA